MVKKVAEKKSTSKRTDRDGILFAVVGRDAMNKLRVLREEVNAKADGPAWSQQDIVRKILKVFMEKHGVAGILPSDPPAAA
jgi:hypothetical protein